MFPFALLHTSTTIPRVHLFLFFFFRVLLLLLQVYGRSALLLSGGGGLGIYHLGVIKALFEADLLPRIVSGSSAGAICGAILCCYTGMFGWLVGWTAGCMYVWMDR